MFLLKPSPETNQLFEYDLALAAHQTGVLIHTVCAMSNHWHGVVTDPEGRLPEFLERFHRLFAKSQNAALGRRENLWSSDKVSIVHLATDDAVLEKMAYVIANPTSAQLVASPEEWPGVISQGAPEIRFVERPAVFFDKDGALPENTTLEFVRPRAFGELTDVQFAEALARVVEEFVTCAHDSAASCGTSFIGRAAVLGHAFTDSSQTSKPFGSLSPRIAAKAKTVRVMAIEKMHAFVRAYREAWHKWRDGCRDVVFPAGTYALRIHARVACASR